MKIEGNIIIFEKEKYDYGNNVVKNVLSDDIRCHDEDGKEYICRACDRNLKGLKYPQKCVFADQESYLHVKSHIQGRVKTALKVQKRIGREKRGRKFFCARWQNMSTKKVLKIM